MEVHHHPDLHHKPKPWKEYFLEFVMIFLAVTLGFFAENIREHFVEKKKEKDVISSFKAELKKDTARLNSIITVYYPTHIHWTDSLIKLVNSSELKGNEQKFFLAIANATVWQIYATPEIALNTLKNSGYFNLLENDELKSEILGYDGIVKSFTNYSNFLSNVQHSVDTSTLSLYSLNNGLGVMNNMYLASIKNGQLFISDRDIPSGIEFKTYNKNDFIAFIKKMEQITLLLGDMNVQYHFILDQEIKLLKLIEKEYPE